MQALEIPRFQQGQITSLDEVAAERMRSLMQRILARRTSSGARPGTVVKITDAKPMIDWFASGFDCQIVYLTRHPIPRSLSCIRNGWTLTVAAHRNDPEFVQLASGRDR